MIFEIPIDISTAVDNGIVSTDVELDGSIYELMLTFCDAETLWYLDLTQVVGGLKLPVLLGVGLITGYPLLFGCQTDNRPAGELIASGDRDAGRTDVGTYVKLLYYDAEEIAAL